MSVHVEIFIILAGSLTWHEAVDLCHCCGLHWVHLGHCNLVLHWINCCRYRTRQPALHGPAWARGSRSNDLYFKHSVILSNCSHYSTSQIEKLGEELMFIMSHKRWAEECVFLSPNNLMNIGMEELMHRNTVMSFSTVQWEGIFFHLLISNIMKLLLWKC